MFTQNEMYFFVTIGVMAGAVGLVILSTLIFWILDVYYAICRYFSPKQYDEGEDYSDYTTMDIPSNEYAKLMYIRNYGVEAFIDAVNNGDFTTIGGEA